MNIGTAAHIAQLASGWQMEFRERIKAIAELRRETGLGLFDSKQYLEQFDQDSETYVAHDIHLKLFEKLCSDFVQSPEDLLNIKREQLKKLQAEIDELEATLKLN